MAHGLININGIPGESTAKKDYIEATSCSHGMSKATDNRTLASGRGNPGGVQMGDFSFTKEVDKSSPQLRQACCGGRYLEKVEVELCETIDGEPHACEAFTLEKVVISNVQYGGALDDMSGRLHETVTLTFGQITWAYTPVDDNGKPGPAVRAGWDCITNKPI